jgi:ribosomal protein S2
MFYSYFTIKKFIDYNIYLGHSINMTDSANYPFIIGLRSGFAIINLEYTLLALRNALMFSLMLPLHKRSMFCFMALNKSFAVSVKYSALKSRQTYFVNQ